ncbi:MFS transporter [Rhodococcus sp. OK302]|jgi:MFS transporter, ACS family, hexuronate transporter|uniref:MFS transporter n=1 Tax=Rhodococcus sp. OK302 TaxID=1882769 RepID=UPI000B9F5184|nr:MFS transporter [Rhodococcus sp. OK302]OYD61048.1 sugar phosphate permease [Rhodococcus sp. OK302]
MTTEQVADPIADQTRSVDRRRAWSMTGLVVFLYVVNFADKAILGIIAQPLARELGLSSTQIGMVGSLFFLTFTIGGFLAGPLNKYLSLRWALLILTAIWSVVLLPLVVAASLVTLIVGRMLLGLAEGPSSALMHTAAYSWHPPAKRGLPGAFLMGSGTVGKLLLAPVLTYLTVSYGWRTAVITLTFLGIAWSVCWLIGWKEGPYVGKSSKSQAGDSANDDGGNAEPSVPWRKIFLNRTFLSCSALTIVVYALTTVVLTWLPSYFEKGLGYSALQAGSMFALPSLIALVLMIISTVVTDRWLAAGGRSRTARILVPCISVLIGGSILAALPLFDVPIVAVIVLSLGYGAVSMVFPLLNAAISDLCPPQQTAGTMGVFLATMAIGGLIAPYATGVIVDHAATPVAGYGLAFQGIGVLAVIAAVGVLIFADPDRDRKAIRG